MEWIESGLWCGGSAVVLERLAGSGGAVDRPALEVGAGAGVGMGKVVGAGCGK